MEDAGGTGGAGGSVGGGAGGGGGGGAAVVDAGVPEKFIFFFEASPSLSVTDPTASRVVALQTALSAMPNDPNISVAVMAFSGSVTAVLNSPSFEFTPLTQWAPADRATMATRLSNFTFPGSDAGASQRDWIGALSNLYAFLYRDTMRVLTFGEPLARYTIVFVSDGSPTYNQDDELLCGDVVARLRGLSSSALDVRFHTVHVFMPSQPVSSTCLQDAGVVGGSGCALPTLTLPGVCPILQIDIDAERLRRMAARGGGRSLDARTAPVDFAPLFQ